MIRSVFTVRKMDCPSEEALIRSAFEGTQEVHAIECNIAAREVVIFHSNPLTDVLGQLDQLKLDSTHKQSDNVAAGEVIKKNSQKTALITVLIINAVLFAAEMLYGYLSGSMGLVADSLDMLADAFVYGLSLYAIGHTVNKKKKVARASGYIQMLLAFTGLAECVRRFFGAGEIPEWNTMIIVSLIALAGNAWCYYLLRGMNSSEANIKASVIFTSNDIIINLGVIAAAIFVTVLSSPIPDLAVGLIVFLIVLNGARTILALGK